MGRGESEEAADLGLWEWGCGPLWAAWRASFLAHARPTKRVVPARGPAKDVPGTGPKQAGPLADPFGHVYLSLKISSNLGYIGEGFFFIKKNHKSASVSN